LINPSTGEVGIETRSTLNFLHDRGDAELATLSPQSVPINDIVRGRTTRCMEFPMHRNLTSLLSSATRIAFAVIATAVFTTGQTTIAASQQGGQPPGPPPAEALQACEGKAQNDICSFTPPGREAMSGTCIVTPENSLACAPEGGPPPKS
jgi:hypothetical protein